VLLIFVVPRPAPAEQAITGSGTTGLCLIPTMAPDNSIVNYTYHKEISMDPELILFAIEAGVKLGQKFHEV
jgi:hypothetical protein